MRPLLSFLLITGVFMLGASFARPVAAQAVTDCDRLAADPADRQKITRGASNEDLFSDAALAACADAVSQNADSMRLAYQYGRVLVLRNKAKQGVPHLTRAAEAGYLAAQLVLASGYASGAHFKSDALKSYRWYKAAAAQGSNYAQATIGALTIEGKGVEKNVAEGVAMLEGYAAAGNGFADYSLGVIFLQGTVVKKDVPRAIRHYENARKRGLGAAFIALGLMYISGEGGEKDVEKAHAIFREGAEAGHAGVRLMLAQYYQGRLFEVADPDAEARRWLCKAGQRGEQLHLQMYGEKLVCK